MSGARETGIGGSGLADAEIDQAQMFNAEVIAQDLELSRSFISNLEPDGEEFSSQFAQVFGVELLFEKIAAYLNLSDLKALRAVSPLTFRMVRDHSQFRDGMKLQIIKENWEDVFGSDVDSGWKNLAFKVDGSPAPHPCLRRILLSATHLELLLYEDPAPIKMPIPLLTGQQILMYYEIPVTKFVPDYTLHQLLTKPWELRSLILDVKVITQDLSPIFKDKMVRDRLARLDKLYITTRTQTDRTEVLYYHRLCTQKTIHDNLRLIGESVTALTEFGLDLIYSGLVLTFGPTRSIFFHEIERILQANRQKLQSLTLKGILSDFQGLRKITFPELKQLCVEATKYERPPFLILIPFLRDQPFLLLERLSLTFAYGFPVLFMDLLRAKSGSLKALTISAHLVYKQIENNPGYIPGFDVDFSFLKNQGALEEFSFYQHSELTQWPYGVFGIRGTTYMRQLTAPEIIPQLPRTLKKLELTAICGFGRGLADNPMVVPALLPWNWDQVDNNLHGFPNLTHLSLLGCPDGVSNQVLQIFFDKGQLTVLEFSNCKDVTEACLNGTDGFEFRLRDLKGLRKLTIFECALISGDGLVVAVKFQELQHLTLWLNTVCLLDEELIQIGSSNPSLEHVSTRFWNEQWPMDLKARVKMVCPRMKLMDCEIPVGCEDSGLEFGLHHQWEFAEGLHQQ